MGSLMAGWDSPILDPKYVAHQRNKSFTKEEIEAFWRSKKKLTEDELHKATSSPSDGTHHHQDKYGYEDVRRKYQRSNSLPSSRGAFLEMDTEEETTSWEKLINNKGWWTRSNWAFLNEPPVCETTTSSYASQFHVANLHHNKTNNNTGTVGS